MQEVGERYAGVKVFSLPSMGGDGARQHIELGVRGDPREVAEAIERIRAGVKAAGFPCS